MANWVGETKENAIKIVIQRICDGESLRSILQYANREILPTPATFLEWVKNDNSLAKQYARACEVRADAIADEILEIADEANADVNIGDDGKMYVNGEVVQRSRLKIDARKWLLSKMQPKKYGDKLDLDHQSSDGSMTPKTTIVFTKNE